jgi:ribonuclease HI
MTYYFDGFTLYGNPSPKGGGFTVTDVDGMLIKRQEVFKVGMTNNEAELLGCLFSAKLANHGDTLVTDSKNTIAWVRRGIPKARPDLTPEASEAKELIKLKNLTLEFVPREENLAGILNETY